MYLGTHISELIKRFSLTLVLNISTYESLMFKKFVKRVYGEKNFVFLKKHFTENFIKVNFLSTMHIEILIIEKKKLENQPHLIKI